MYFFLKFHLPPLEKIVGRVYTTMLQFRSRTSFKSIALYSARGEQNALYTSKVEEFHFSCVLQIWNLETRMCYSLGRSVDVVSKSNCCCCFRINLLATVKRFSAD